MKFLKLEFKHARLIKEKSKNNMLGSNRFFHPINKIHIYNSLCILLDRTPKPQLRETDDKFMPFYKDILDVVNEGYIKTYSISDSESITTIKKAHNSNAMDGAQYTWKDCKYITGTLFPIFIYHISNIFNKKEIDIKKIAFDDVMSDIHKMGTLNDKNEINYDNSIINDLIRWCKSNSSTGIANYIENKQISSRPTNFGKRVHRGIVNSSKYNGIIYIPLTNDLHSELTTYTKGFSTILDGGLVTILDYCEIYEDDINDFIKISLLNSTRKFDKKTTGVKWDNTIYKNLDKNNLETSINNIIKKIGISIQDNQEAYDSMIKKVAKLKFDKVAYKVNFFIEQSINKQYNK